MVGLSLSSPVPKEAAAAAPLLLPFAYPYAVPVLPNILHTGLHYPLPEGYVHDPTGDVDANESPAAEVYAHVEGDAAPEAVAYVHDVTGDVSDDSSPAAEVYVHDTTGDT